MNSLQIDANISSDCKTIKFYELTGPYSASNTTGWSTPNEETTDATNAELTITTPAGNSYTFDSTSTPAFFNQFPTSNTSIYYSIVSDNIGYGTNQKIPDGVYRFTYTVITNSNTYTKVIDKLFYCNTNCCVNTMFSNIDWDCDCSKRDIENAKKAYLMLQSLKYAANCGQKNYFSELLDDLNKLCTGSCTSC